MSRSDEREQSEPITVKLTRSLGENATPQQFEVFIKEQVENWGSNLESMEIKHLDTLQGYDGDYEIDITARFRALGGSRFLCLFECKRYKDPVKRRDFQTLLTKLHSVGGQKAYMVSLSGFQSGAIAFARVHGMAAITIAGSSATFATMWPFH